MIPFSESTLRQISEEAPKIHQDSITVVFCIRNERFRLPFFLSYYRSLGVDQFLGVDNDSDDGSSDYLLSQNDVHVFHTVQSYKSSNAGRDWTTALASEFCLNRWCLTVDVDEFFVYPFSETVDLKTLVSYLDYRKYEGMFSIFLDFYSDKLLSETKYNEGESPFDVCSYFDRAESYTCYEREIFPHFEIKGGVRQRAFWGRSDLRVGPSMRKLVLIKWKEGFSYTHSTHSCTPVRLADITGAVAHFKFLSHFKDYAKSEVTRNSRIANSVDWKVYTNILNKEDPNFYDKNWSLPFKDSFSLLEARLITGSLFYHDFCSERQGKSSSSINSLSRSQLSDLVEVANIDFAELIKIWPATAMFSRELSIDSANSQSLARFEADLNAAVKSPLWRWSYALRKFASKLGLTDQRTLTEENFHNQTLHARFTFTYKSIWWDMLGPFRVIQKIVLRIKRKSN